MNTPRPAPTASWLLARAEIARQDAARFAQRDPVHCHGLARIRLRDAQTLEAWASLAAREAA